MPFRCPYCDHEGPPITRRKISPVGWLIFVIMVLTCALAIFAPFALLIREERRVCAGCGTTLG
jgi:hypothetical protein